MAAEVKSPSDIANPTGLANFLGPPKLLGRDDKLATLVIKVDEGSPHLKIIDQGGLPQMHRETLHGDLPG